MPLVHRPAVLEPGHGASVILSLLADEEPTGAVRSRQLSKVLASKGQQLLLLSLGGELILAGIAAHEFKVEEGSRF